LPDDHAEKKKGLRRCWKTGGGKRKKREEALRLVMEMQLSHRGHNHACAERGEKQN